MAYIELQEFRIFEAYTNIFTAHLTIDPTIKDTIIRTIKDGGDKQNRQTNVKASMTDYRMQYEPGFVELEKEITSIINYLPEIVNPQAKEGKGYGGFMEIRDMWGMVYKKNDYTDVHAHWPSVWSGSFYLDIPTDYAGTLFFPELEHHIEPITGQLVLFSGSTLHGVKTIQSNGERLVVSFNYYERAKEL
jgi:hypothetical protein